VDAPFDARGIMLLTYRYKDSDKPRRGEERRHLGLRADAAPRAPHLDRAAHRRDLGHRLHLRRPALSFNGIVPQYEWTCLGEMETCSRR
jgi:hypothetical protein